MSQIVISGSPQALPQITFPEGVNSTQLATTLQIKQIWMFNEWGSNQGYLKSIKGEFPERDHLSPNYNSPDIHKIEQVFDKVRGSGALWTNLRETGVWTKVEISQLDETWVNDNIRFFKRPVVKDPFQGDRLEGLVLWQDEHNPVPQLLEGNHRLASWLLDPKPLPCTLFVGRPKGYAFV